MKYSKIKTLKLYDIVATTKTENEGRIGEVVYINGDEIEIEWFRSECDSYDIGFIRSNFFLAELK